MTLEKPVKLFIILNALFLTFLLMAELTGSKLFQAFGFTMTMGVIPFPVTFIITDILNEYYGRKGVRFTTLLGMIMVLLAYLVILIGLMIPASPESPVNDLAFETVFANSGLIIIGSVVAYLIGQLVDIQVFHYLRIKTGNKHIWLRATGSTIVSQLIDSFVVIFIALGKYLPVEQLLKISSTNFIYKLGIAILITPLLYLLHNRINRYLGDYSVSMVHNAMEKGEFYGEVITPG